MPAFHPDPLGQCLLDYFHGDHAAEVIAHCLEANDYDMSGELMFRTYEEFLPCEKAALAACSGQILDIGAGAGSHALWLQAQGHSVAALDISAGAVEVMRLRGLQATQSDIFSFHAPNTFDTALMLMNGIGVAGTLAGVEKLLRHLKTFLSPAGQIIFDSSDMKYMFELPVAVKWMDGKPVTEAIFELPTQHYYGEFSYQMSYHGKRGEKFRWVYVDIDTMHECANRCGYTFELLAQDENAYAARLSLKS